MTLNADVEYKKDNENNPPSPPPLVKRGRGVYQVKVSFKGVKL